MSMGGQRAARVRLTGRVQGCGFRAWTLARAEELGLHGWVRNLTDGRVEALLVGQGADVATMIDLFWTGPQGSGVTDVVVLPAEGMVPARFDVKPTVSALRD
jgi:acylphosphatase